MKHTPLGASFLALLLCVIAVFSCTVLAEASSVHHLGEVLYAARFADYNTVRETGIRFGTSSWSGADLSLMDGRLSVSSSSDHKTYLLLPTDIPQADTYTIEYTFRFTDYLAENGYCGMILTSSGDAPSNRTELVFRVSGTVDNTDQVCVLSGAASGEWITVKIIVRMGFLVKFTAECGEEKHSFDMVQLKRISPGGRGFVLRNASVEIASIEIVNGEGYKKKIGAYAASSYMTPYFDDFVTDDDSNDMSSSPHTTDVVLLPAGTCVLACLSFVLLRRRIKT